MRYLKSIRGRKLVIINALRKAYYTLKVFNKPEDVTKENLKIFSTDLILERNVDLRTDIFKSFFENEYKKFIEEKGL